MNVINSITKLLEQRGQANKQLGLIVVPSLKRQNTYSQKYTRMKCFIQEPGAMMEPLFIIMDLLFLATV